MRDWTCDCSEEYGPCDEHCETLAQREGASLRTADELCEIFILDALEIDPQCLSPWGRATLAAAQTALRDAHWVEDYDLSQALGDVAHQVENYLTDVWTYWDDGYRIVRPLPGCPLLDI